MTIAVERLAAVREGRTAVVDDSAGLRVSYRDLAERARVAADRLAATGVEAGDRVMVVSRNRVEVLALLFAARRLGATLAPVSYRLPTDAVEALCDRLDPAAVLYESAARDLVRGLDATTFEQFSTVQTGDDGEETAGYDGPGHEAGGSPLLALHDADGESVVVFTERAVERNCATVAAAWGLGRRDATALIRPLFAPDGLLQAALPVLYAGGRLVVHRAFDPADALDEVATYGVTYLVGTAAELDDLAADGAFRKTDHSTVEWVAAADPPAAGTRAAFADCGAPVVRSYGGLAAGPNVCYTPRECGLPDDPACVGRPFPDPEVRIVDADGDPVEPGEPGDLAVRGPTTAAGTLADGTAFADAWLRTGDRARLAADGNYWLVDGVA